MECPTQSQTDKGIELLFKRLPYPHQIEKIRTTESSIYFSWRSEDFKLDCQSMQVDKVRGCILEGDNMSMLISHLLK